MKMMSTMVATISIMTGINQDWHHEDDADGKEVRRREKVPGCSDEKRGEGEKDGNEFSPGGRPNPGGGTS